MNKIIGCFWFLLLTSTVALGSKKNEVVTKVSEEDTSASTCYVAPSCTAVEFYDRDTGFTNDTGWDQNVDLCCQICLPGTPPTVCFDSKDKICKSKTGNGDYDFLLLSQIWQPQFCEALKDGHDPTLTHLNGTVCSSSAPQNLRIHGLWPNYVNGYPQCCNSTTDPSLTLDPADVIQWEIYPSLQAEFAGVAEMDSCRVCYTLNHEWLKHGGCYSPADPITYFKDTLEINHLLSTSNEIINSLKGSIVQTSYLKSLYPQVANIICDSNAQDPQEDTGKLLEVRTCWSRERVAIDCPPDSTGHFTKPCPTYTLIGA